MTCPACGKHIDAHAKFCRFCGVTRRPTAQRHVHWGRLTLMLSGLAVSILTLGIIRTANQLPSVGNLVSRFYQSPTSLVYDSTGQVVAQLGGPARQVVPFRSISPKMTEALIAIEDHNFYHNPGFDLRSIARAAYVDLTHHAAIQGASTITEQLAKDLYLSDQKTLQRKIKEFLIGIDLASHYTKHRILDLYLNEVYFGQGADGIAAASHVYFDTTPAHLTLAQATLLAGLPQAPSLYDPLVNLKLAKERQTEVVQAMVRYGDISARQGRRVLKAPLHLKPEAPVDTTSHYPYPWYIDEVVTELMQHGFTMSQILHGGLKIHTALRPQVYQIAQQAVDHWMNTNFGRSTALYPDHQAAAVVENPHNGHVWAIIGGRTHFTFLQSDLASNALRSTGSAIKPLLDYAPAIAKGYTQMSVIQDVPIFRNVHGQSWWPSNDNFMYRGYMDLRDALAISDNDVAVQLLNRIGLHYAIQFLRQRFDITLPKNQSPTLGMALGVDTNLLDLTRGYAALDNSGTLVQPIFVTRVTLHHHMLFSARPTTSSAISPDQAFIITDMLRRVLDPHPIPSIGPQSLATGYRLGLGRPAAAKSGTNNHEADAWFLGYEPQMTVGVWEGDRIGEIAQPYTNSGDGPAYGAVAAGPIWHQIMQTVNRDLHLPAVPFTRPTGVTYVKRVSITSGDHPSRYTPKNELQGAWYIDGTVPQATDPTWYPVKVAANNPATLWHPGCGPFVTITALRRESQWHPGVPLPWDSRQWAPTTLCSPSQHRHHKHGQHHKHHKHHNPSHSKH